MVLWKNRANDDVLVTSITEVDPKFALIHVTISCTCSTSNNNDCATKEVVEITMTVNKKLNHMHVHI